MKEEQFVAYLSKRHDLILLLFNTAGACMTDAQKGKGS